MDPIIEKMKGNAAWRSERHPDIFCRWPGDGKLWGWAIQLEGRAREATF